VQKKGKNNGKESHIERYVETRHPKIFTLKLAVVATQIYDQNKQINVHSIRYCVQICTNIL
jgi:hypothetical protein